MKRAQLGHCSSPIFLCLFCLALAAASCGSEPAADPGVTGPVTDTPVGTSPPAEPPPASTTPPATNPPPVMPPPVGNGFPCDVHAVLQASCANCHAGRIYYGPNFHSRDDLFRPALELFRVVTKPVAPGSFGEHIATSLREGTMPPYGALRLPTDAERQLVIDWIAAGMPAGSCGMLTSQ